MCVRVCVCMLQHSTFNPARRACREQDASACVCVHALACICRCIRGYAHPMHMCRVCVCVRLECGSFNAGKHADDCRLRPVVCACACVDLGAQSKPERDSPPNPKCAAPVGPDKDLVAPHRKSIKRTVESSFQRMRLRLDAPMLRDDCDEGLGGRRRPAIALRDWFWA